MKKFIALLMAAVLVFGLAACGGNKQEEQPKQEATEQVNAPATEAPVTEAPTEESKEAWGAVTIEQYVETENGINSYLINFPEGIPYTAGGAQVALNADETITMVGGEDKDYFPAINSIEELLPAYTEGIMTDLGYQLGSRYEEMDLVVESQELVEANGYTFCKYVGTHTFKYMMEPDSRHFVLYAVHLNNSDAYAYWIVFDRSEDQSNLDLIADHAYNMALTLQEK